jgi:hypothetical protein
VSINTVSKLLVCIEICDELVRKAGRVHCGEIWSLAYQGKERCDRQDATGRRGDVRAQQARCFAASPT